MSGARWYHYIALVAVSALIHQVMRHGVNSLWHLF